MRCVPKFRFAPSGTAPRSPLPLYRDKPHNISVSNALAGGAGAGILSPRPASRALERYAARVSCGGGGAACGSAVVVIGQQAARARCREVEGGGGLLCSASRAVTRVLVGPPAFALGAIDPSHVAELRHKTSWRAA